MNKDRFEEEIKEILFDCCMVEDINEEAYLEQMTNLFQSQQKALIDEILESVNNAFSIMGAHDCIDIASKYNLKGLAYQAGWRDGQNDLKKIISTILKEKRQ